MSGLAWLGFGLSTVAIVAIARKNLWVALGTAALVLGLFTIPVQGIMSAFLDALLLPSNILLGISMALIPVIGTVMEASGQINALVGGMRISKRALAGLAPAMIGLLPVPGGAMISAPVINVAASDVKPEKRCALNVWFRHVLFLIYPASTATIVAVAVGGTSLYETIAWLLPWFALSITTGVIFFLKDVKGNVPEEFRPSRGDFTRALLVIAATPAIDLVLRPLLPVVVPGTNLENVSLVIAIGTSATLAIAFAFRNGSMKRVDVLNATRKAKPWSLFLFITCMFFYLNTFQASGIAGTIASYRLDASLLLVAISFVLGFITGRVQVPMAIVIPIYMGTMGIAIMFPVHVAIALFSAHTGYLLSPVHPCLSITLNYFGAPWTRTVKDLLPPTLVSLATVFLASILAR